MSLNAALVDRARRIVDTPLPIKVEGTTVFDTVPGSWFKCRLTLPGSPEADDAQGGRRRVAKQGTILMGVKDVDHNVLALAPTDKLEVNSPQLGRAIWNVTEDPMPLRKKRKVIGYQASVTLVEENEFVAARP